MWLAYFMCMVNAGHRRKLQKYDYGWIVSDIINRILVTVDRWILSCKRCGAQYFWLIGRCSDETLMLVSKRNFLKDYWKLVKVIIVNWHLFLKKRIP